MEIVVNGVTLFYETAGNGSRSILLLHGNGESGRIFDRLIPELSADFTVYAMDSRNQGRSGKSPKLSYQMMVDDTVAFIQKLKIEKPILYGFSDGGIIGLLIAMQRPQLLSKLIISGANLNPQAIKAPWPTLVRLIYWLSRSELYRIMAQEPNISPQSLQAIEIPTLVLAGEKDLVKREHSELIAASIPNAQLRILPGEDHGSYIIHSPKLYPILKPFLFERISK